jgi:NAD+ diphosphatase
MMRLLFSGDGFDSSAPEAAADALYLRVRNGEVAADGPTGAPAWQRRQALALDADDAFWVSLGQHGGVARFAAIEKGTQAQADPLLFRPACQTGFRSLFQLAKCAPGEQRLAARAVHLGAWLHRNRRCGLCGAATAFHTQHNKLQCTDPACGQAQFARVEPSIAALVVDGPRCLLARGPGFPKGYYAPLAGFVEPGETPEHTVAREVFEEVGLRVHDCRYVISQPWPFPASLMLGFIARVAPGQAIALSDELEEAIWMERDALRAIVAAPGAGQVLLPPSYLIGAALIGHWLDAHE